MKMTAQIIEQLLPSTSNITIGTRNNVGLLPYLIPSVEKIGSGNNVTNSNDFTLKLRS